MDPQYPQYNQQYTPAYRNTMLPQPNTLVWGILGLAFTYVLGIIFGAIGRSKGNQFIAQGGTLTGASKVGYILSKAALIVSIIVTIILTIYFIIIGLALSKYR